MSARNIVLHFFKETKIKPTKSQIGKNMIIAGKLLESYTETEILQAINHLIDHPPAKGFYSLGFVEYVIDDILNSIKAAEVKEQMKSVDLGGEQ